MLRFFSTTTLLSCLILAGVASAGNGKEEQMTNALNEGAAILPIASVTIADDGERTMSAAPQKTARKKTVAGTAPIAILDRKDINKDDRLLIDGVLRSLPPLCRNTLRDLVVRYDAKAERGQSTATSILLDGNMPQGEMAAVLVHECGHIIDLGGLRGTPAAKESVYPDGLVPTYQNDPSVAFYGISWQNADKRRAHAEREDFVSGYAKTDPWEDFAESFAYYVLHEQSFRDRAAVNEALAAKLSWMETYVFGPTFKTPPSTAWNGEVVWDVTKLPHKLAM